MVLLITGLSAFLLLYVALKAIKKQYLARGVLAWSGTVGLPGLLFALCASAMIACFFDDPPYYMRLVIWPVFIFGLEPGYRLVGQKCEPQNMDDAEQ